MFKRAVLICAASLFGACATYAPVPKDYSGPTASVRDTGVSEDGAKAQMFALMEIDGNRVMNAFWASANASHDRGLSLTTVYPEASSGAVHEGQPQGESRNGCADSRDGEPTRQHILLCRGYG
jgi:hypothetical protein